MVERHLAKVNVASSNLVFRSKQKDTHLGVFFVFWGVDDGITELALANPLG